MALYYRPSEFESKHLNDLVMIVVGFIKQLEKNAVPLGCRLEEVIDNLRDAYANGRRYNKLNEENAASCMRETRIKNFIHYLDIIECDLEGRVDGYEGETAQLMIKFLKNVYANLDG